MMISSINLRRIIEKDLPNARIQVSDEDYVSPSFNWIRTELYSNFVNWLRANEITGWKTSFDCDRYAFAFYVFCNICHARTMAAQRKSIQGIAVGIVYYIVERSEVESSEVGHAINFIQNRHNIFYIEPQNGRQVFLTEKEKKSAWWVVI